MGLESRNFFILDIELIQYFQSEIGLANLILHVED
jgi:hypothetical protein